MTLVTQGLTVDHILGIPKKKSQNHTPTTYVCQMSVNFTEKLQLFISNNKYQILTSNHILHKTQHAVRTHSTL